MEIIKKNVSYWYMRYLLVTELFMVERWERNLFHIIASVLLIVLGLFNHFLVVGGVSVLRQCYYQYMRTTAGHEALQVDLRTGSTEL